MTTSMVLAADRKKTGKRAVVIGSSMAGLLASRVLADYFEEVTVVERDQLLDGPEPRKAVPQAQHVHVLLAKGAEILQQLFPDLFEDLVASGSLSAEMADAAWFHFGSWKARPRTGVIGYFQTRTLLEWKVRQRVKKLECVRFLEGYGVTELLHSEDKRRILGVQAGRVGGGQQERVENVDLVVDASGRGSQTPRWLEQLGYSSVQEELVKADVGYTSRLFHRPRNLDVPWKVLAIYPKAPTERRFGIISPVEGDRWIVSMGGWLNEHAPADDKGFLDFARTLPRPELYEVLKNAQPAGPLATHKFPGSMRRHYERMPNLPEGLVVLGDALCSFNPVYGQGMTTCALEAMLLNECLGNYRSSNLQGLSRRFQEGAAAILENPWRMATGEDFRYPEVPGRRPPGSRLFQWYGSRLHMLAAYDPVVVNAFVHVQHMLKPPTSLFSPRILLRVAASLARVTRPEM